jgi:hypothetical protein
MASTARVACRLRVVPLPPGPAAGVQHGRGCEMWVTAAKWGSLAALVIALPAAVAMAVSQTIGEGAKAEEPKRSLPFGVWGNYPQAWGGVFSGGHITVTPENMLQRLSMVRRRGMRVVVSMAAGSKRDYQNKDGTFSMAMWKARLDAYRRVNFRKFLEDGTIIAQHLLDDIDESHWGDKPITNREIDELARYSKRFWPRLLTAVRARPSSLMTPEYGGSGRPFRWRYLDAAWNQYSARMGNPLTQMRSEVRAAKRQGLALVVGLNVLTGGNGLSGLPGPDKYSSDSAMSPAEVIRYGTPLITHPYACAFLMWSAKYDYSESWAHLRYTYFKRPEIRRAMQTLRALADRQPSRPCSAKPR